MSSTCGLYAGKKLYDQWRKRTRAQQFHNHQQMPATSMAAASEHKSAFEESNKSCQHAGGWKICLESRAVQQPCTVVNGMATQCCTTATACCVDKSDVQNGNKFDVQTLISRHRLSTKVPVSGVNTSTRRALISLSANQRLTSSMSSFTIETPSTKIKGAKVVAGLNVPRTESSSCANNVQRFAANRVRHSCM